MDRFSGMNSASRLNQAVDEWTKQQRENEAFAKERQKQREELEKAQMGSAEDIRKMLEMMQVNQREQAEENKKTKRFTIWGLVISVLTLAATIIFGMLQVLH